MSTGDFKVAPRGFFVSSTRGSQKSHRHRGASFEARRPQGAASRQCSDIYIVPLDPAYKAGVAGHVPAEPLECGHDWTLWDTLVGIKNRG